MIIQTLIKAKMKKDYYEPKLTLKVSKEKRPWFFVAQDEAYKELRKQFKHVTTDFQEIGFPRVFNKLTCWNDADKEPTQIMMTITKQGNAASVIIWDLTYRQGWHRGIVD